ncbi:hypothetical protein A2Z67_05080 [Candidatus Woesebacteria bacterium RBG_13_36_22]|uniref:Uncharacterized protein n=1 Tax=Candidatus Woesebacteria bacterium RBG_13_36_22 TaxID=1802478 RepID=A0A1F7X4R1_9BACT|nr:MAG: hypothetical protein A2Z67_05080 [Candidatus Woesebacteria bacterium RBG_13_36_22]
MLKEIVFAYQPTPNLWGSNQPMSPFTIAFCYTPKGDPFVVKGGWIDVEKYIKELKEPLLVHTTFWWRKSHRTLIKTYNLTETIYFEERKSMSSFAYKPQWKIFVQKDAEKKILATVRRMPRKWMKELNPYIPLKRGEQHKRLFRLEVSNEA